MKIIKLIQIFLLTLMLTSMVSAGSFIANQNEAGTIAQQSDKVNTFQKSIFATDNTNFSVGNLSGQFDFQEDFILTDDMYLAYEVTDINETLTFYVQWGTSTTPDITEYTVSFDNVGTSYFAFSPEYDEEALKLRIDYPDSKGFFVENFQFTRVDKGLYDLVGELSNMVVQLLEINLGIWKILYYVFILGILFSVLFVVISLIMKMIEFAEKFAKKRRKAFGGGK